LISALILFGADEVAAQVLTGITSQKQAIELLKSQGKILPNVATDYGEYGKYYAIHQAHISTIYPYGSRARYEANNLKNIDGKNIEIDNDVDSCNFLNETVYKANLDKIVPIIIDIQIDTL
jgi:hypothetical protein